jgi:hypothetical protein
MSPLKVQSRRIPGECALRVLSRLAVDPPLRNALDEPVELA